MTTGPALADPAAPTNDPDPDPDLTGHERPTWERPALIGLLIATAGLYLWGLGGSHWANAFYSAAAQAGSVSWKAWFYAASDSASSITVDKPPMAMWVMGLSARIFGVNPWSILVPQALMGVGSVALLYATVRRWFRAEAALLAGAALALTPVAALMFRYNNPDALLTLLLLGAAYTLVRALEHASTRWAVLVGVLVGMAFLTKMLQAFLVVPGFALVYLLCAPTTFWRRVWQLALTGVALLVSSFAWVLLVMAIPVGDRPYIGGSQDNSLWNLMFGYNGVGRLNGNETGSVGGGPPGTSGRWGITGLLRMFGHRFGGQISWLLPAALLVLAVGLVATLRRPRTDRTRAALLVWGGWLVVSGIAFSLGQGIIHEYYTVVLAPPIAALVGVGMVELWQRRERWLARLLLVGGVLLTTAWSAVLLYRVHSWVPWVRTVVVIAGLGAAVGLLLPNARSHRAVRRLVLSAAVVAGLGGPLAFTTATVASAHEGALPLAGPEAGSFTAGTLRGLLNGSLFGGPGGVFAPSSRSGPAAPAATVPRPPVFGRGAPRVGRVNPFGPGPLIGGRVSGGTGSLLDAGRPSEALTDLLKAHADRYTWVAATVGSNNAAGFQLAAREPVMPIGGFNGTDPSPTLAQFQSLVAHGKVHWYILSDSGRFRTGGHADDESGKISRWVRSAFQPVTVDGATLYDLTAAPE